jgi:hypothetical protein
VYRHFPSLDHLVGACGALTMQTIQPPAPQDAARLFAGARTLPARVERLVREMASFYGRSQRTWVTVLRDCHRVEPLREFIAAHRAAVEAHVREALRPVEGLDERAVQVACALVDYPTWQSLADRGLRGDEVVDEMCRLVLSCVKRRATRVSSSTAE